MRASPTCGPAEQATAAAGVLLAGIGVAAGVLSVNDQHNAVKASFDSMKTDYSDTTCVTPKDAVAQGLEWKLKDGRSVRCAPGKIAAFPQVETTSAAEEEFRSLTNAIDKEIFLWQDNRVTPGAWIWFVMGIFGVPPVAVQLRGERKEAVRFREKKQTVADTLGTDEKSAAVMRTLLKHQKNFDPDTMVSDIRSIAEEHRAQGMSVNDEALEHLCSLIQSQEFIDLARLAARADEAYEAMPTTANMRECRKYDHRLVQMLYDRVNVDGEIC